MAKFYPKHAFFESKSQVAPNSLVFNPNMTDGAVRFILALNAIATCAPNWTPVQTDIQKRLRWGRDKMCKVIKECIKLGYLMKKQKRQDGQFNYNEFEFDTVPSYLKTEIDDTLEKSPHNECEPMTCLASSDKAISVNPTLPCIKTEMVAKDNIVCSSEEPSKILGKCEKKLPSGESFTISLEEIFSKAVILRRDWNAPEINEAWEILYKYKGSIRDPISFIEGTIKNIRKIKQNEVNGVLAIISL